MNEEINTATDCCGDEDGHGHSHGHGHDHGHSHEDTLSKKKQIQLAIGTLLFAIGIIVHLETVYEFLLFGASYLLIGGEVVLHANRNIRRGKVFDENFLMSIATIGAFSIGEFAEGVAVMLFYQIGELFQARAVNNSRKSITALLDIRPDFVHLKHGDQVTTVSPSEANVGDLFIVKPGEKIPLDGEITEGETMLDTAALTGESVPRKAKLGDQVLSGSINLSGLLTVRAEKEFGESTVAKILDLVQNASNKKARTEQFMTKFARIYTPIVVYLAIAIALIPSLFFDASFSEFLNRALIFLVISCPCALVVSIPLGFFGGIGAASRNGILIKGGNYLEALNNVDTVVFDKTGTLTKGVFNVTSIVPRGSFSQQELLHYAAFVENYSTHPIATSIKKAYDGTIDVAAIAGYKEISGHGIEVLISGTLVCLGNEKLMRLKQIPCERVTETGTIVHIAVDGIYAGYMIIADEIKPDSAMAISALRAQGINHIAMLSGDNQSASERVASQLALDEIHAELLPDQKVEKLEDIKQRLTAEKARLLFVGDGINDAPVLAFADVGVAMGGLGSDAAIEAADIVLMTDEPSKLARAIKIAKKTRRIVWQNIAITMIVKGIVLILGAGGLATMWEAVFADVGVALIAIFNAMRIIRTDFGDE